MAYKKPIPDDMDGGFTDAPFVAGSFTGRRAFRVTRDTTGELHLWGTVYEYDWSTTDVNIARCMSRWFYAGSNNHQVASMDCHCGFFAYFQETPETRTYRNSIRDGFGCEGVIFGWGRATVGSLGFRCSKARILGLVVPDEIEDDEWPMLQEAMAKFGGVRWYGTTDALLADHPLTKAGSYGLIKPADPDAEGAA